MALGKRVPSTVSDIARGEDLRRRVRCAYGVVSKRRHDSTNYKAFFAFEADLIHISRT